MFTIKSSAIRSDNTPLDKASRLSFLIWLGVALIVHLTGFSVKAQDATTGFFRNFTIEQGLPSDYISKVVQGEDGFMWFGTNNGLVRYDGYDFVVYSHNPSNAGSISGDYVSALAPMNEQLMWVGLYEKGLDLFDTQSGKTIFHLDERTMPQLPDNRILKLWVEKDKNRLWICTIKYHFFWLDLNDFTTTVPTLVKHPNSSVELPETNTIYAIEKVKGTTDEYWMATNDGLVHYNEKTNSAWFHEVPNQQNIAATANRMRTMLIEGDKIWVGSRGGSGLNCFDIPSQTFTPYPYDKAKGLNFVLAISRKSANELWVGSIGSSLLIFNTETKKYSFFTYDTGLPSNLKSDIIFDITTDDQSNTWFATKRGIAMYSNSYQLFTPTPLLEPKITNSPNFFKIWSILEDENSLYFGCSAADGLIIYDKKNKVQRLRRPLGLSPDEAMYIYRQAKDQTGRIWLAALNHLLYYDPAVDKFTWVKRPHILGEAYIHSVVVGGDNRVYFGTRKDGLFVYDQKTGVWQNFNTSNSTLVSDIYLHDLLIDNEAKLWISTSSGLSVFNTKTNKFVRNYASEDGFKAIFKFTLDKRNRLWMTSENDGVKCIDTKTMQVLPAITKQHGLLSNTVEYVETDESQNLWIATHRGLCVYNLESKTVFIFDSKNGLQANHVEGAAKSLLDGNYVQGFTNSFVILNPRRLAAIQVDNPPTFTHFKIFDLRFPIHDADTLRLKHTQNFFSIGFSALNFSQPEKLIYQYQLTGVDQGWVNANELRLASYTNISAGNYIFKTRYAVKGTQIWSPVQQVWIIINPPFWETWWFCMLLIICVLGLIYYLYKIQIDKVRKIEAVKTETNRQLAALEMKALRSQMNPHFIFNSLNSIKYYVIRNETNVASRYLSQFSKLIRRILTNSESDFIKLSEELEMIELYLEMEKLRFGDKLTYYIEVDSAIDVDMIIIPTMLIQPYIENAVWHGIMHKTTNGKLQLCVRESAENTGRIEIVIADDGIGRQKSCELRSNSLHKKSLGMRITGERIELLNKFHQKNIMLTISDLDNHAEDPGTQVILTLDMGV